MAMNLQAVQAYRFQPVHRRVRPQEAILYALAVGAGAEEPTSAGELKYVYEDGLVALPTMAVVLASEPLWIQDPVTGIDWPTVLHGEQRMTLHRPIPVDAELVGQAEIGEIFDKGPSRGVLVRQTRELRDAHSGDLIATLGATAFLRGEGGFPGLPREAPAPHAVPDDRPPDLTIELLTRPDQALLYRLTGDHNALHVDPAVAAAAGFERPILHGLCTYGFACRAVLRGVCRDDPARLRRFDVRFSNPVFPGETLRTEIWREGENRAAFRTSVVESGRVVLNNGLAEFD
jgi:acyl dehydratase